MSFTNPCSRVRYSCTFHYGTDRARHSTRHADGRHAGGHFRVYNVNLKHETLKGMKENAEQGFHCGGRAPFGYRLAKTRSKVNYALGPEEEVNIIKQIFCMAADGMGGKRIARLLNEQGIPAGRKWLPSSVLAILANEAYLGHRVWNKKLETGGRNRPHSECVCRQSWAVIPKNNGQRFGNRLAPVSRSINPSRILKSILG